MTHSTELLSPPTSEEACSAYDGPAEECLFLAERRMPGLTLTDRGAVQRALLGASRRVTAEGHQVRLLHSGYIPAEERWFCLFVSSRPEVVRRVFEIAQLPNASVAEVMYVGEVTDALDDEARPRDRAAAPQRPRQR